MVDLLGNARNFCFEIDGWSSISMDSYLGIVIKFYNPLNGKIHHFLHDMIFCDDHGHTGMYLFVLLFH